MVYQGTSVIDVQTATISNSAQSLTDVGFSQDDIDNASIAYIACRSAGVMVRWDGTAPTSTVGHLINADGERSVSGKTNVGNIQLIREGSSNSTVTITLE